MYDILIDTLERILLTLGTSIQVILYLIVSLRRVFRCICNIIRGNRRVDERGSLIRQLIEANQIAYYRNMS